MFACNSGMFFIKPYCNYKYFYINLKLIDYYKKIN